MARKSHIVLLVIILHFIALVRRNVSFDVAGSEEFLFPKEALPTSSGYLTVNENSGARMFYVFYEAISPATEDLSKVPLILWLQGGPGCSSMIGNFYELGPWRVNEDQHLYKNDGAWNRLYGLLFVDNPVGTGFSIAPNEEDIPSDEEKLASDLFTALQAFFIKHKSYQSRPFYVMGESYAGKYVPALSYRILQELDKRNSGVNSMGMKSIPAVRLDGLAIGNGLTHPIAQVNSYAPVAYYIGLIDNNQRLSLEAKAEDAIAKINQKDWYNASIARGELLNSLSQASGLATLLDIRRKTDYYTYENGSSFLEPFLNKHAVKKAIGADISVTWVDCSSLVDNRMQNDIMKSTKWMVEALLHRVPVLLYQGQFDLQDGVASTEAWLQELEWNGAKEFLASKRNLWLVNETLAGYVRSYETLAHVVVVDSGHLVPADQSIISQTMIESWISGLNLVKNVLLGPDVVSKQALK
ncbi:hypothetical protein O6H91_09G072200 [Diphasiastrum complanatum]|uniref:Uncharacterized protein n=1 Tax=Diphasiastrum complanatum TaxID=34168 RepID=A0ACC2CQI7_DIPCM|nr:hypothetical protein O6H91_Y131300 [Diphasiastrum complanatum]KAJ7544279.1 hypothetical protein O6H91_09G072200 [Diphasiastrum complanatum]